MQRDKIAAQFHQLTEQIEAALSDIPYDKLDLSEEVREQVLQINFVAVENILKIYEFSLLTENIRVSFAILVSFELSAYFHKERDCDQK